MSDPTAAPVRSSLVSVDVLALHFDRTSRQVKLGVTIRQWAPFAGQPALPGVLLGDGERLKDAALRALTGKLQLAPATVSGIGQVVTFDEPNRDPRGPTLSVAMWAGVIGRRIRGHGFHWTHYPHWRLIMPGSSVTAARFSPGRCGGIRCLPDP